MLFESDLEKVLFSQFFKCYHSLTHTHKPQTTDPTTQSHNQKLQIAHTQSHPLTCSHEDAITITTTASHSFKITNTHTDTPTKLMPKESLTKPANSHHNHNYSHCPTNTCTTTATTAVAERDKHVLPHQQKM